LELLPEYAQLREIGIVLVAVPRASNGARRIGG
jgi:hypothetical protein